MDLEHDGDTFDHEWPLIIFNGAQISLVQAAKRVQIFLDLIVILIYFINLNIFLILF